jgi:NAD(P)H-binding
MPLYQRSDRDCLYRKLTHTFYSSSLSRSQAPCCMPVFRRVVVVESVAFLLQGLNHPPPYLPGRLRFPSIVADASAMEEVFENSGLDWTMVRPPELTDQPYTGK